MSSDDEHLPKAGEIVAGKYRIERILGKGGMGAVLAAHHELLGQRVAIKFLLGEIAQNSEAVQRFHNEARNAFKIQSEHVCRVMDVGEERGMPFMVMEYMEGGDLSQAIETRGALPVEEAVDFVLQALEAIASAHAQGIVHRDLKPANLFLAKRQDGGSIVKVLDFGIAKASNPFGEGGNHSLTSTKSMLGSPLYMSPEQLRSAKNVDARADIWAIGVILYELLSGTVPFNGETLGELFIAILEQPPVPLTQRRQDVPQGLNDTVMRCLTRGVEQRIPNVAELAVALAPFAPARSFVSVERVATTLGLPRPSLVTPNSDASGPYRPPHGSYASSPGMMAGPQAPYVSSSGSVAAVGSTSSAGTPMGMVASQTNATWGQTGGGPTAPASKAPLLAGLGVAALLVCVVGGLGVYKVTHMASATVSVGMKTPVSTSTEVPGTSAAASAATTAPAGTDTSATVTTATVTATAATVSATASAATVTSTAVPVSTKHTGGTPTAVKSASVAAVPPTTAATVAPTTTKTTGGGAFNPNDLGRH